MLTLFLTYRSTMYSHVEYDQAPAPTCAKTHRAENPKQSGANKVSDHNYLISNASNGPDAENKINLRGSYFII
jgi:hypothetical protein